MRVLASFLALFFIPPLFIAYFTWSFNLCGFISWFHKFLSLLFWNQVRATQTRHTGVLSEVRVKICEVRIWELVLCFPSHTTVNPGGILVQRSYSITSLYIFSLCKVDKRQEEIQNTTLCTCQIFQSFHIWTLKCSIIISLF